MSAYGISIVDLSGSFIAPENVVSNFSLIPIVDIQQLSEEVMASESKLILIVCDGNIERAFELCKEVKDDIDIDEIPIVILSSEGGHDIRLAAYEAGCDDVVSSVIEGDELSMRLNKAIFHRIANEQLAGRVSQANDMAFSAMANTADLGVCLQFFLKGVECANLDELGQLFFQTMEHFGLHCSLQIRSQYGVKNMEVNGMAKELESQLLEQMMHQGRFYDFGKRTIVNYESISILIKNMPIDDDAKYGMIKDNILTVVEGVDMKTRELDNHQALINEKELMRKMTVRMQAMMKSVDESFSHVIQEIAGVVETMAESTDKIIPQLLMSEQQEESIVNIMRTGIAETQDVFSRGLKVDEEFQAFLKGFDQMMTEDHTVSGKLLKLLTSSD